MDAIRESTGERLQNLCREGGGSSTSEFEEMKEAGSERMGGMVLQPEKQERNRQNVGSKEDVDGKAVTGTETEDVEGGREEDAASEESDENTVTDTEIEQVEGGSDTDASTEKEWAGVEDQAET